MTGSHFPTFTVPPTPREFRSFATLLRSFGLLNGFRYEQTDPNIFYGHLTEDTVGLLEDIAAGANASVGTAGMAGSTGAGGTSSSITTNTTLYGERILDVDGGPGYLGRVFAQHGVEYCTCGSDVGEMATTSVKPGSSVCEPRLELPFCDGAFNLTYSSNVAEHVPEPRTMDEEVLHMTELGGLVVYSYAIRYDPSGGHEVEVMYCLGGGRVRRMYGKKHGKRPENYFGKSLFRAGCDGGSKWAHAAAETNDCELLAILPRYHPRWVW